MPKYRVIGAKVVSYWTTVEATDRYDALDKAEVSESIKWHDLENDNVIEPIDVMEEEDEA